MQKVLGNKFWAVSFFVAYSLKVYYLKGLKEMRLSIFRKLVQFRFDQLDFMPTIKLSRRSMQISIR